MINDKNVFDPEELDEQDLLEAAGFERMEDVEPDGEGEADGVGTYDRAEIVHGYIREHRYGFVCGTPMGNLPIPSRNRVLLPADLTGMSDADVLSLIDIEVVSRQSQTSARLLETEFANILVDGARMLGLRPLRALGATVRDLMEALEEIPEAHRLVSGAVVDGIIPVETPIAVVAPHWADLLALSALSQGVSQASLNEAIDKIQAIGIEVVARMASRSNLAATLADLLSKVGLTANAIAPRVGLDPTKIQGWLNGVTPSRSSLVGIKALEEVLSAPVGTLVRHVPAKPNRMPTDNILTAEVREEFEGVMIPLACLGYDWFEIDDVEKRRRVAEIRKEFIESSPYRQLRLALAAEKYRYPDLPPLMAKEFEAIVAFKSGRLVPGLKQELTQKGDGKRQGGRWKKSTRRLQKQIVRRYLGFAYELMADDPAALAAVESAGLALFCRAQVLERLVDRMGQQRFKRMMAAGYFRHVERPEDDMVFVPTDVSNLWMIAGWLSEKTGYLWAKPPQLTIIPGWLDAEWVARAEADWRSVAMEERASMAELARRLDNSDRQVREPRKNVQALLDLERPLDPILEALARFDRDRPSFFESPRAAALHDRDYALLQLWVASRLRRENLTMLTYDPETNQGKLRRAPTGGWRIVIPRQELKNAHSKAYGVDMNELVMDLPRALDLEEAISRWVDGPGCSRAMLHGKDPGTALFPGTKPETDVAKIVPLSDDALAERLRKPLVTAAVYRIVMAFSSLYLAHLSHRPGVPGVKPFGVHTIRMLVGTHVLLETGAFHDAAIALFDDVATVEQAYAWISELQKSRLTNRIFERSTTRHAPSRPIVTYA